MNYSSMLLLGIGGLAVIIGVRKSYRPLWSAVTGTPQQEYGGGSSGSFASTPSNGDLATIAQQDANAVGISPHYFLQQMIAESGLNPNAKSPAGAEGIAQFMPSTAASLGINPWDPIASLKGAATYMKRLIDEYGGSEAKALAAYNAGEGTVNAAIQHSQASGLPWYTFLPYETQNYITKIEGSYN
jgi:soluble lytic murein transglycosylase-like protein